MVFEGVNVLLALIGTQMTPQRAMTSHMLMMSECRVLFIIHQHFTVVYLCV